ncbi:MAG: N-glycosylase/DNA lyase [Thermoplasmatota archaeon]
MNIDLEVVEEFHRTYADIGKDIGTRLSEFREIWDTGDERRALNELLFCILTPQSKAQVCWGTIEDMACTDILLRGSYDEVLEAASLVRFKYKKARYLIEARERFFEDGEIHLLEFIRSAGGPVSAREWFVKNIKGLGYKEASHFLRNIGLGERLTILDRHILRNLARAGVIEKVPPSMTDRRYLQIETSMIEFSDNIGIPVSHLDLVIWHIATGTIFK